MLIVHPHLLTVQYILPQLVVLDCSRVTPDFSISPQSWHLIESVGQAGQWCEYLPRAGGDYSLAYHCHCNVCFKALSKECGFAPARQCVQIVGTDGSISRTSEVIMQGFPEQWSCYLPPTVGVVVNPVGSGKLLKMCHISVSWLLSFSVYRQNKSKWSMNNDVSHYFKWLTGEHQKINCPTSGSGGVQVNTLSFLSGSWWITSFYAPSLLSLEYSTSELTSTGRIVFLSQQKIRESTWVLSKHVSCHCPERAL